MCGGTGGCPHLQPTPGSALIPAPGQQWAQFPGGDSGAQLGPMTGSTSQDGAEPGPAATAMAQIFTAHPSPLWWPNTGSMDGPYPVRHKTTVPAPQGSGPAPPSYELIGLPRPRRVQRDLHLTRPRRKGQAHGPAGHRTRAQAQAPAASWEEPVPTQTCSGVSAGMGAARLGPMINPQTEPRPAPGSGSSSHKA